MEATGEILKNIAILVVVLGLAWFAFVAMNIPHSPPLAAGQSFSSIVKQMDAQDSVTNQDSSKSGPGTSGSKQK